MLDTVLIVGLGLMGSNLGLKLRSQGVKVYGKDRNKKAYTKALNSAVIDEGTPEEVARCARSHTGVALKKLFEAQ